MKRCLHLLIFALPIRADAPDLHDFYMRVVAVEMHWDVFVRTAFGCKADGPTNAENCTFSQGRIDPALYDKWWKAAKKLHGE